MSSLARIFLSLFAASASGGFALLVGAIFLPLVFPLSVSDAESVRGGNMTVYFMGLLFLVFGAVGFLICWHLANRACKDPFANRR